MLRALFLILAIVIVGMLTLGCGDVPKRMKVAHDSTRECKSLGFPTKYDGLIKKAWLSNGPKALRHRNCLLRAQIAKESSIRADADSGHAYGLGQQIPAVEKRMPTRRIYRLSGQSQFAVNCAAWKDSKNYDFWWPDNRTEECHTNLMLGSYVQVPDIFTMLRNGLLRMVLPRNAYRTWCRISVLLPRMCLPMQEYISTIHRLEADMKGGPQS